MVAHFDDPTLSDLKFVDGKPIHVHRMVLKMQCDYFRKMFEGPWTENNGDTITVAQSQYPVYRAFLRYFYTGDLDIDVAEAFGVFDLANSCCESILKVECYNILKRKITTRNCVDIFTAALRYEAEDLRDFCCRFAAHNLVAVTRTEAYEKLPEDLLRKFIARVAEQGAVNF